MSTEFTNARVLQAFVRLKFFAGRVHHRTRKTLGDTDRSKP